MFKLVVARGLRWAAALTLPGLLGLLGACAMHVAKPEVFGKTVTVGVDNSGQVLTLGVDQELIVKLESDANRDYAWVPATPAVGVLVPVGRPGFEREGLDTNTFGGAGFDIFRYRPSGPGEQTLQYEYRRGRERLPATPRTVVFNVTVR